MTVTRDFEDGPNPCPCPAAVIEALALAVRYAEASLGSSYPDAVLGAGYVKTFMEQPSEVWCRYIEQEDSGGQEQQPPPPPEPRISKPPGELIPSAPFLRWPWGRKEQQP